MPLWGVGVVAGGGVEGGDSRLSTGVALDGGVVAGGGGGCGWEWAAAEREEEGEGWGWGIPRSSGDWERTTAKKEEMRRRR